MNDFEQQVITGLTELRTSAKAVEEHLARLNGKVAKHEEKIGELLLEQAQRQSFYPLVEEMRKDMVPLKDHVTAEQATAKANASWWANLKPAVWGVAGFLASLLVSLAVEHGDKLKPIIFK